MSEFDYEGEARLIILRSWIAAGKPGDWTEPKPYTLAKYAAFARAAAASELEAMAEQATPSPTKYQGGYPKGVFDAWTLAASMLRARAAELRKGGR